MRRRLPNVTWWWIVGPIAQVLSSGVGIGGSMEPITRQEGASREERLKGAKAERDEAEQALVKADRAWAKAGRVRDEANRVWVRAARAWDEASREWIKTDRKVRRIEAEP